MRGVTALRAWSGTGTDPACAGDDCTGVAHAAAQIGPIRVRGDDTGRMRWPSVVAGPTPRGGDDYNDLIDVIPARDQPPRARGPC